MSTSLKKEKKKIPRSIMVVGTFQVAIGLWAIFSMAVIGNWNLYIALLAIFYTALGAGLLAIMEWARFAGVIVHAMVLPYILANAIYGGQAGLGPAIQIAAAAAILFILTRPHIRTKFRRPSTSS